MVPGSVGFQCPDCVQVGARQTRQNLLPYGGTRSANPRLTSLVLIGINLAVWVAIMVTGRYSGRLFNLLAMTPANRCAAQADGSFYIDKAYCLSQGMEWGFGVASEPWQVITSGFTHVEVMHIGFNMLVLYMLGPNIEQILGRARFLAVYFVSLIGGSAAVMLLSNPYTQTLGASGAIYGLIGSLILIAIKHRGNVRTLLMWLGINVVLSLTWPNLSWQGHLGGLLGGVLATAVLIYLPKERRNLQWPLLAVIAVGCLALIGVRAAQLA